MALNKKLTTLMTPGGPATGMLVNGGPAQKVTIHGSFLTNGASDPVASSNRGDPFKVVHTSTGLYTVSLGGGTQATGLYTVKQIIDVQPVLGKGAAGNALKVVNAAWNDSAGTFAIRLEDAAGAATDLAAATDNRISFSCTFWNGGR